MDKIRTDFKGGMPAIQEHFGYLQNAYGKAFEALVESLNYNLPGFILYGCQSVDNGSTYTISAGAIVLNGEILQVDSHNVTKQSGYTYTWSVDETDDPDGTMIFFDGSSKNVYAKRRGKVRGWIPPSGSYMLLGQEQKMEDLIKDLLPTYVEPNAPEWQELSYNNGWQEFTDPGFGKALFTKLFNGFVQIEGYVHPGSATSETVSQLPAGSRPASKVMFITPLHEKRVEIDVDGYIKIPNYYTGHVSYYLNVIFPTDRNNVV